MARTPNEQGNTHLCNTIRQDGADCIAKLDGDQQVGRIDVSIVMPCVRPEERNRVLTRHDVHLQHRYSFSEHFL
ncbi:hypothetical protein BGV69_04950 [Burkholderia ubonensis]|nr:hypothetical protein BGV69_04950 [Burkholderia ubonensis]